MFKRLVTKFRPAQLNGRSQAANASNVFSVQWLLF